MPSGATESSLSPGRQSPGSGAETPVVTFPVGPSSPDPDRREAAQGGSGAIWAGPRKIRAQPLFGCTGSPNSPMANWMSSQVGFFIEGLRSR